MWTDHEIFALACQADLNNDSYIDCLAGGRAGVFLAGLLTSPLVSRILLLPHRKPLLNLLSLKLTSAPGRSCGISVTTPSNLT